MGKARDAHLDYLLRRLKALEYVLTTSKLLSLSDVAATLNRQAIEIMAAQDDIEIVSSKLQQLERLGK
jgi:hypothetical protein